MLYRRNYFRFLVDFRLGVCVSADAATDLTFFGVLGFDNSFPAFEATRFEVCPVRAIK